MLWNGFVEFGFVACLFVNAALFVPQAYAIYKAKQAEGLSLTTFLGFNIIQLFTVFHGLLMHDYILALGYLLSILTCGSVSFLILYYRHEQCRE